MRGKLPWWLVVPLGWVMTLAAVVLWNPVSGRLAGRAADAPGPIGVVWYMGLAAAAIVGLALVVAAARGLAALADAHRRATLIAILAPLALWAEFLVLKQLAILLRR
jgi:hypothetical protein